MGRRFGKKQARREMRGLATRVPAAALPVVGAYRACFEAGACVGARGSCRHDGKKNAQREVRGESPNGRLLSRERARRTPHTPASEKKRSATATRAPSKPHAHSNHIMDDVKRHWQRCVGKREQGVRLTPAVTLHPPLNHHPNHHHFQRHRRLIRRRRRRRGRLLSGRPRSPARHPSQRGRTHRAAVQPVGRHAGGRRREGRGPRRARRGGRVSGGQGVWRLHPLPVHSQTSLPAGGGPGRARRARGRGGSIDGGAGGGC